MIKPQPKVYTKTEARVQLPPDITLQLAGYFTPEAAGWLALWGFAASGQGNVAVQVHLDKTIPPEGYALRVDAGGAGPVLAVLTLHCGDKAGLRNGLNTAAKLLRQGALAPGEIKDAPSFALRGIIEGFYGWPWPQSQRFSTLELLAKHNINTYFYAPKDDIYHRDKWDEPYDEASLRQLEALIQKTQQCYIDFYYCLGPGITLSYASAQHFDSILQKYRQVYALGVRHFGIFLDDIPGDLQYPADKAKYKDVTAAHIDFVGRVSAALSQLDPAIKLAVCPLQYFGTGEEEYITAFGRGLTQNARLMWTGENICAQKLGVAAAKTFTGHTGHLPLYWDNYPVNDAGMVNEMHLGPLLGRDKDLHQYSHGIIANGMTYSEASKIPFLTIADYLWNSGAYAPEESWQYALRRVAGEEDAPLFAHFAEHLRTSCLQDPANSGQLAQALYETRFLLKTGEPAKAEETLAAYTEKAAACQAMLRRGMQNTALQKDLARWEEKFHLYVKLLQLALQCLQNRQKELVDEILNLQNAYNNMCPVLTDFCFEEFLDEITQKYKEARQ